MNLERWEESKVAGSEEGKARLVMANSTLIGAMASVRMTYLLEMFWLQGNQLTVGSFSPQQGV